MFVCLFSWGEGENLDNRFYKLESKKLYINLGQHSRRDWNITVLYTRMRDLLLKSNNGSLFSTTGIK